MCPYVKRFSNTSLKRVCATKDKTISNLHKEFGALDVDDEGDRVIHGHAPRPVAFGDEGGEPATSAVPHGEVDDQIKMVFLQVVHDAALLLFSGTPAVILLKRPIHSFHLKREKLTNEGKTRKRDYHFET